MCYSVKDELKQLRLSLSNNDIDLKNLYHYSNAEGLLGIFESKTMWATNSLYLNDKTEINYTHQLIEKIKDHLLSQASVAECQSEDQEYLPNYRGLLHRLSYNSLRPKPKKDIFVTSFCEKQDLLSQWRGYGESGLGYALGFKTKQLENIDPKFTLYKIIYSEDKQKEILTKMVRRLIDNFDHEIIGKTEEEKHKIADDLALIFEEEVAILSTYFKHPSFKEEEEWRLVYIMDRDSNTVSVKFRANMTGVIPYIEIGDQEKSNRDKLPIVNVMIGPTVEQGTARKALRMLTCSLYPELIISNSGVPLQ